MRTSLHISRRPSVAFATGTAIALLLAMLGGPASPANAAASTCTLVPVLRDVTVTQGVSAYPVLVRGKESLARFFLSLPSCASSTASIAITGAKLTIRSSYTTATTITAYSPAAGTTPRLAPYSSAPAVDSTADPKFVIPPIVPSPADTGRFAVTFSGTISYSSYTSSKASAVNGTITFSNRPGTTTAISMTVERKTNAFRVLVVPMGDARQSYASQFDSVARTTTQNGMTAAARKLPVPDSTGDLGGAGGLRYTINPTLLDLSRLLNSSGKFCGTGANFDAVKAQLAQFLQSWNTANPLKPADRVLGVVKDTISLGGSSGCAEGMSVVNGPEAWVRAIAATSTTPSNMGSLTAMELGHTMGLVPLHRADPYSPYHSPNTQADLTSPNRAYNVGTRSFLADDKTALTLSGTWNDTNTLFERDDWATLLCALGGGTTADCPVAGTVGTSTGVGAEPTFVISGTTDGSAGGTSVVESYFATGVPRTTPESESAYRLVQLHGDRVVRNDGVPVRFGTSLHDDDHSDHDAATGLFSVAFPFDTATTRIELRHGSSVLYSRNKNGAPQLTSTTVTPGGSSGGGGGGGSTPATVERVNVTPAGMQSTGGYAEHVDLSGDGQFVAFASTAPDLVAGDTNGVFDVFVRDLVAGTTERVSVSSAGVAGDARSERPSISDDGRFVAFHSNATNLVPGDSNGFGDIFVRDRATGATERVNVSSSGTEANNASLIEPLISSTGRFVLFATRATNLDASGQSGMFLHDRTTGTTERVSVPQSGTSGSGEAQVTGGISDNGDVAGFSSYGPLVPDQAGFSRPGFYYQAFVRVRSTATTELVSVADGSGAQGDKPSYLAAVSADGRYAAFNSEATNFVAGDTNGANDVFVRDRVAGTTIRVAVRSDGMQANGSTVLLDASSDLRHMLLSSAATNLVADDTNGLADLFLLDRTSGVLEQINVAADGTQSNDYHGSAATSEGGTAQAFTSAATNLVSGDTNVSMDVFHRTPGAPAPASTPPPPVGTADVSVTATDDQPGNLRLDLIYTCGDVRYPVAVGVDPDDVSASSAAWKLNADTTLGCADGTLSAVVNDGFTQASPLDVVEGGSGAAAKPPVAAISAPSPGTVVRQFDPVTLAGSGKDAESGELTGNALSWTVDGPGTSRSGSGSVVDLAPPAAGWTPGSYTVSLRVTDASGTVDSASTTFTAVADADHDGLSAPVEGQACFPAGADHDFANAYTDHDADGIPNADDATLTGEPCVAATSYDGSLSVSPNPLPLIGTARTFTVTLNVPFRTLNGTEGSSVAITGIAGKTVTGFMNVGWTPKGTTATVRFQSAPLLNYLKAHRLTNRPVTLVVSGTATSRAWAFATYGTLSTQ